MLNLVTCYYACQNESTTGDVLVSDFVEKNAREGLHENFGLLGKSINIMYAVTMYMHLFIGISNFKIGLG